MASRNRNYQPLRVRATLRTGVVSDQYLPLDGILHYQAHREKAGAQVLTYPGAYSTQGGVEMPLAQANGGQQDWFYRCSWAQWPDHVREGRDFWNKRFDTNQADLIDFGRGSGKMVIDKGEYKNYRSALYYRAARWVEWFCVGDKTDIERLLSCCTHVGSERGQGWGRVIRWEVETWPEDWSVWQGELLMRGIPIALADDWVKRRNYGVRPSYWHAKNKALLAVP